MKHKFKRGDEVVFLNADLHKERARSIIRQQARWAECFLSEEKKHGYSGRKEQPAPMAAGTP